MRATLRSPHSSRLRRGAVVALLATALGAGGIAPVAAAADGSTPAARVASDARADTDTASTAVDLRVDGARQPLGVDLDAPRFSWQVDSTRRAVEIAGYRLVVATTAARAAAGQGDVWETTGTSERPGDVTYDGPVLNGSTRYFWAVQPVTDLGVGSWSEAASFETALADDGWSGAEWIGGPNSEPADVPGAWPAGSVATASSSHSSGGYAVSKVIDGDRTTYWNDNTNGAFPDWVQVVSPTPVTTEGITLTSNKDGGPKDFTVEARVDGTWQTVATVTGENLITDYVPFTSTVTADALRITITALWEGTIYPGWSRIGEIELGDTRAPGWPSGTVATASTSHSSGNYAVSKAIDGDPDTYWNDNTQSVFPDWIQVTSLRAVDLPGITLIGNANGGPKDFVVTALVGGSMQTVATVTGNTAISTYVAFDQPITTTTVRITVSSTWDSTAFPGWTRVGEIYPGVMPTDDTSAPLLRRDFDVDPSRTVQRARLYVTGVGNFVATLNGRRVGDDVLDPAFTMYNKRVLYVTHDITDSLRSGSNAIGLELGRGFYGLLTNMTYWDWDNAVWHGEPRALVKLVVDYTDGTSSTIVSDDSWTTASGPRTADSVYTGEAFDARRVQAGWATPSFDDSAWEPAVVVDAPAGRLMPQQIEPVRFQADRRATTITERSATDHVYDFGGVRTGWVGLSGLDGPAGTTVQITYGERLKSDGSVDAGGLQTDTFTLAGTGAEEFEPQFTWKSYRYVEIVGAIAAPTREQVVGRTFHTDVETTGSFDSDNELYDRIHAAATTTLSNNLTGYPTDTPMYEKNGWTGDFMLGMGFGPKTFGMERFIEKWLGDIADAQLSTGAIPLIIPADGHEPATVDYPWGNAPEWSAAFPTAMWTLYEDYGLLSVVREHWSALQKYLDFQLGVMGSDFLTTTSLGDWVAPEASSARELTSTAYVYQGVEQARALAAALGDDAAEARYAQAGQDIKDAFNTAFFRSADGWYQASSENSYRQASNAIPLVMGLVPAGREQDVADRLQQDVAARGNHLATGILGTAALLPALTDTGHADTAAAVVNQRTAPSWGYWLDSGVDTLLEDWTLGARSRNHYMFGTVDSWFYDTVAGVSSVGVGGQQLLFAPHVVGGVTRAEATLGTIYGTASTSWHSSADAFDLDADVPTGATATVEVPVAAGQVVTESGRRLGDVDGVLGVEKDGDVVRIEVGSGDYSFRAAAVSGRLTTSGAIVISATTLYVGAEFTGDVTGLTASDFTVENGAAVALSGSGGSYVVTVRADADGVVRVALPAGAATTADGSPTPALAPVALTVDTTAPTVTAQVTGRLVVVTAQDAGSGVASVEYRLDGGDWQPYLAPIAVDDREHEIGYRATDAVGNTSGAGVVRVAAVPTEPEPAPVVVEAPSITGVPQLGRDLTVDPGVWDPADVATTLTWLRDGVPIAGASAEVYRLRQADLGHRISVLVEAVGAGGAQGAATTAPTSVVRKAASTTRIVRTGTKALGRTVVLRVTVSASGLTPHGVVRLVSGGQVLSTKRLTDGERRFVVRLSRTTGTVRAVYAGGAQVQGSSGSIRLR